MADLEKVIRGLECVICPNKFCGDCSYFIRNENDPDTGWCNRDAIYKAALSLLKAQEPVEPEVDVDTWICGKCGHKLEHQEMVGSNILFHEQYSYCPNCGKAVKWDG